MNCCAVSLLCIFKHCFVVVAVCVLFFSPSLLSETLCDFCFSVGEPFIILLSIYVNFEACSAQSQKDREREREREGELSSERERERER